MVPAAFAAVLIHAAGGYSQTPPSSRNPPCLSFASAGRLLSGRSYVAQLPRGLELHLRSGDDDYGWDMTVTRPGGTTDYMWVVSPPYRTAPQRKIGPGYGLTASESASLDRDLRFVLNDLEYAAAVKIVNDEPASAEKMAKIEAMGRGRLSIHVDRFALRPNAPALDWIEFTGEACVPR